MGIFSIGALDAGLSTASDVEKQYDAHIGTAIYRQRIIGILTAVSDRIHADGFVSSYNTSRPSSTVTASTCLIGSPSLFVSLESRSSIEAILSIIQPSR